MRPAGVKVVRELKKYYSNRSEGNTVRCPYLCVIYSYEFHTLTGVGPLIYGLYTGRGT
jgi:hypothetical protein